MFGKNKNKKVGLCVMVVTSCFILATLWAVLATPETALAKKPADPPGGGGGGKDKVPTCVKFDAGGSVRGDQDNAPYYHDKKGKITVKFSNALSFGDHLLLQTNSTDKANVGRGLFIDFGTPVILAPGDPVNEMPITTTDDLDEDRVLGVSATLRVGSHQAYQEFDFNTMQPNEINEFVNLRILVVFDFKDGGEDHLFIRLDPDGPAGGSGRNCLSSDPVTVTYGGIGDGLRTWRVETQTWDEDSKGACLSRSSDCDKCLLLDVDPDGPDFGLDPGHIALNFGFTVTAAP